MTTTKQVEKNRRQAIKLLTKERDSSGYAPIDYAIDDECRQVLKLPPRPNGAPPYETWMVGEKQASEFQNQTSIQGVAFIKQWEGLRLSAYKCPAGVWTIGYGHTKGVKPGDKITELTAVTFLRQDLIDFEQGVLKAVRVPLKQNQFDALVSLAFNIGVNAFKESTLVELLNRKDYQGAADQFPRWRRAGDKVLPGLQARRKKERSMFLK